MYLDKALLASVSPQLAAYCSAGNKLPIGKDAFRLFVAWILYRKLDTVDWFDQKTLAEAWNLGADYDIPGLQNAAMTMLIEWVFKDTLVDPDAVKEAYRSSKRSTELQTAFVTQIGRDGLNSTGDWSRKVIVDGGMDQVAGFCLDLAMALTEQQASKYTELEVGDFLVEDHSPVDEYFSASEEGVDSEDDESDTEG